MSFVKKYGPTALIAGASEGMGLAYARALAARGFDLVLVARRRELLEAAARSIAEQCGVRVLPIVCDLGEPDSVAQIADATRDLPIDFLVYNAAQSYIGPYLSTPLSTHREIATVNTLAPLAMLYHFGQRMVERRRGGIVLMASIAGFQGTGYLSTYAATKAFDRVLAEGLWYEWKPFGVDVIACCAGATATPNYVNTQPGKASRLEPKPQSPEQVVEECLRRIGKTPSFVSGAGNRFVSFLMQRVFPRRMAIGVIGDGMKRMYRIH
jgi:short-subunit dehydrogenase